MSVASGVADSGSWSRGVDIGNRGAGGKVDALAPELMIVVVESGTALMQGGGMGTVRQLYGLLLLLEERREQG